MANIEYSRLLLKRSVNSGVVPTVPLTNNLNDFNATDIYEGELFYNIADGILFSRDLLGITVLGTPGAPQNLLNTLLLGNNTGATDIVIDTNQVIRNPNALFPDDAFISVGTTPRPNEIKLRSEDLNTAQFAQLTMDNTGFGGTLNLIGSDPVTGINTLLDINSDGAFTTFFNKSDGTNTIDINHDLTGLLSGQFTNFFTPTTTALTYVGVDIHSDFGGLGGATKWTQNDIFISSAIAGVGDMRITSAGGGAVEITAPQFRIETAQVNLISSAFGPVPYQSFDDDAAAAIGGLVLGDLYQTTGGGAAPLNAPGILMIKQ